jgi:hypothetical protein
MNCDPIEIVLTNCEVAMGADCGVMRNIAAWDRPDAYGFDEEFGWNAHIEGACGEIAVAKALGRFWSPTVNTFKAPDIGLKIQVRTRWRHDYELYVRPDKDDPDHAFVLATGKAPRFVIRGYRIGRDARREEWLQAHGGRRPAWFVPTVELWPWKDLCYREVFQEAAQ